MTFPLIQGEQFAKLADFSYRQPGAGPNNPVFHENEGSEIPDKNCTIFCCTHWLDECLDKISQKPYIYKLISHNSDASVVLEKRRPFDHEFKGIPNNVSVWYAQNLDVEDPAMRAIPIGFENNKWYPNKKLVILENIEKEHPKAKLLYVNHDIGTNPGDRIIPYQLLEGKPWATLKQGKNGQGFGTYFNELASHKFVICPDGNGLDTHRIYEALSVGTIPIVQNHVWSRQLMEHFDFVIVNDWSEVTEEKMEEWEFIVRKESLVKNPLYMDYWKGELR